MPSSVIQSFDYEPAERTLLIEFTTGRVYVYFDVPPDEVEALQTSASKGRYFNAHIREHYAFREVTNASGSSIH